MKRIYLSLLAAAAAIAAFSCTPQNEDGKQDEKPPIDINEGGNEEEEEEWTGDYPKGVSVEPFSDTFSDGKTVNGWIATVDFKANPRLKFNTLQGSKRKAPTEFFRDFNPDKGTPYICVNAGYFAGSTSVSLCIIDGKVRSISFVDMNWPNDENCERVIHPVRSALGQQEDGSFDIEWVFCTNKPARTQTVFPNTMGNNEKTRTFNEDPPSADYPGAYTWTPQQAIGGGPRLLKDGVDVAVDSYWEECLDSGGTAGLSRQPRTAMGLTEDGKLIILVCDGRGMGGSAGMTLKEVAAKLKSLGAVDAMNFDGGGSSQIVGFEGKILNLPSDAGAGSTEIVERKVVTAVVISELPKGNQ